MRKIDMGKYRPFAHMGKTCKAREIKGKKVVWPYFDECLFSGIKSTVLGRSDVHEAAELWRLGYGELYGSSTAYDWVLYSEQYEDKVALKENWKKDSVEKKHFMPIMVDVSTGRIAGAGLCTKDDRNLQIEMSLVCIHPEYRSIDRGLKLGEAAVHFMGKLETESGAEYITTFAETWHNIVQYICLKRLGWKIAGIFPGQFTRWCGGQKEYRGCTVHLYKFVGDAEEYVTKPEEWQLLPEVADVWAALEKVNRQSGESVVNGSDQQQSVPTA